MSSSCFHVALIVFLRCLAIAKPYNFRTWHERITDIGISIIWIFLILICLVPTMICTKLFTTKIMPKNYKNMYITSLEVLYHGILTSPILLIAVMYLILLIILNRGKKNEGDLVGSSKKESLGSMIRWITISTLLCYTPIIVTRQYNIAKINNGTWKQVLNSTEGVSRHIFGWNYLDKGI